MALSIPPKGSSKSVNYSPRLSKKVHATVINLPRGRLNLGAMDILVVLQKFELRVLNRVFRQTERRMVIPLARALSHSGDGYLHVLVPLLLWSLGSPILEQLLPLLALALTLERSLYWAVKNSLRRPRPQETVPGFSSLITASDQFSFPSGHSSGAFLLATALLLVYGTVAVPVYLWACGVALSRILLGVHFPGDTLAGALMGTGLTLLAASLLGTP